MNDGPHIPGIPARNRPVHQPVFDTHNRAVIIFLTVCTKDRRPVLDNAETHQIMQAAWGAANHWLVGRYVIMPDHIHLFCAPNAMRARPVGNWVRFWKAISSKASGAAEGTFWQTDFWDTQLRGHESYAAKWEYVRNNPVRAGLTVKPEDWPYQGEMNLLRWHD
jgi:putative transposase